jgi:hypothetical protein
VRGGARLGRRERKSRPPASRARGGGGPAGADFVVPSRRCSPDAPSSTPAGPTLPALAKLRLSRCPPVVRSQTRANQLYAIWPWGFGQCAISSSVRCGDLQIWNT